MNHHEILGVRANATAQQSPEKDRRGERCHGLVGVAVRQAVHQQQSGAGGGEGDQSPGGGGDEGD